MVWMNIEPGTADYTRRLAEDLAGEAEVICRDHHDRQFLDEFDVVLHLANNAIGIFEDEDENLAVFDFIALSLKPGGKHLMSHGNPEFAEKHFPERQEVEAGSTSCILDFAWDRERLRAVCLGHAVERAGSHGRPIQRDLERSFRLYTVEELRDILSARGMDILQTFGDIDTATVPSEDQRTITVVSQKREE